MRIFSYSYVLIALIAILTFAPAVCADETYYMIIFSYDGKTPRESHTFAAFVKDEGKGKVASVHTISWLPAEKDVRLLRPPESGVNLSLEKTLQFAKANGRRITAWGPDVIKKELFDKAMEQVERLNSGKVGYKALDARFRDGNAVNCIHAVSDVVREPRLDTGTAFGAPASALVRNHFDRWIVEKGKASAELSELLRLKEYEISFTEDASKKQPTR